MKQIEHDILKAEAKWLKPLHIYCRQFFTNKRIPSHDHTHHLRVWEYSKEILHALYHTCDINYQRIESCLIASLFHDIGLSRTLSEKHGLESREICIQYFEDQKLAKPAHFEDILNAIEKHDDKEYKWNLTIPDSISSILCNADDLDAFGNIGIIRYTEIYLLRGVQLLELPNLVIKNLDNRFLNFEKTYKDFSDLYHKHKTRYVLSRTFFEELIEEF